MSETQKQHVKRSFNALRHFVACADAADTNTVLVGAQPSKALLKVHDRPLCTAQAWLQLLQAMVTDYTYYN